MLEASHVCRRSLTSCLLTRGAWSAVISAMLCLYFVSAQYKLLLTEKTRAIEWMLLLLLYFELRRIYLRRGKWKFQFIQTRRYEIRVCKHANSCECYIICKRYRVFVRVCGMCAFFGCGIHKWTSLPCSCSPHTFSAWEFAFSTKYIYRYALKYVINICSPYILKYTHNVC